MPFSVVVGKFPDPSVGSEFSLLSVLPIVFWEKYVITVPKLVSKILLFNDCDDTSEFGWKSIKEDYEIPEMGNITDSQANRKKGVEF